MSEEEKGEHNVSNAPECDIAAVMSANDYSQLRVDIVLYNPIKYKLDTWFGVEFEYTNMIEDYYYFPANDEFYYISMNLDGEVVDKKLLENNLDVDFAAVTSYNGEDNRSVIIIIDKELHIEGEKGKIYFLKTKVASGFFTKMETFKLRMKLYLSNYFLQSRKVTNICSYVFIIDLHQICRNVSHF